MKVFIPHTNSDSKHLGGKSLFCHKLGQELLRQGVDVVDDSDITVDISLNVIRLTHTKSKIKVLRLDGVYHNTGQDYEKKNAGIRNSFRRADVIIYQSYYSKCLCDRYLGKANYVHTYIFNGSDRVDTVGINNAFPSDRIVLAISKWRPHKRLYDIIKAFLIANIQNAKLIVIGDTEKAGFDTSVLNGRNEISFRGHLDQHALNFWLQRAELAIHLCGYDACPNSVVEMLCRKIPVISSNIGGTPELLRVCKIPELICEIDKEYDYEPIDLYNLPEIDHKIVARKIRYALSNSVVVEPRPLYIENIASRYRNFFEELLQC